MNSYKSNIGMNERGQCIYYQDENKYIYEYI